MRITLSLNKYFNMKNLFIFFLVLVAFSSCKTEVKQQEKPQPNIIFIMTDDHAYQAISAYGSELIQTPNIDRLANEGMLFERAYVTNSICSPSRAVVLTGKHSHLNSVRDNLDVFDSTQITFPKILQQNGYQTAVVGKWHLKSEPTGFDYWKILPDQGHYYDPEFRTEDGMIKEDGYVTDVITDFAFDFLREKRDPNKPFLLMYHHKAPHRQWWPAMEDLTAYKDVVFPIPSSLFDNYENRGTAAKEAEMRISDHMGLSCDNKIPPSVLEKLGYQEFLNWYKSSYTQRYDRLSDEEKQKWDEVYGSIVEKFEKNKLSGEDLTKWKYQRYTEDYLGSINSVDRNIGRLLDYLDETGLSENTLVVYTSDQGFYLGEHGWFDKRFMYEESFRTPLIIRHKDQITAGSKDHHLVQNLDFAPTFIELAGGEVPTDMQGQSLIPVLKGEPDEWRDALYYHYYEYPGIHAVKRHYGIRTENYKLIHFYYNINEWELYNLNTDPQEMNNVYGQEKYAEIQKELHQKLEDLRAQYQDSDSLNQQFIESDLARLKYLGWK